MQHPFLYRLMIILYCKQREDDENGEGMAKKEGIETQAYLKSRFAKKAGMQLRLLSVVKIQARLFCIFRLAEKAVCLALRVPNAADVVVKTRSEGADAFRPFRIILCNRPEPRELHARVLKLCACEFQLPEDGFKLFMRWNISFFHKKSPTKAHSEPIHTSSPFSFLFASSRNFFVASFSAAACAVQEASLSAMDSRKKSSSRFNPLRT